MGYESPDGTEPHTGSLNGGAELSYANTGVNICSAALDQPTTLIFPGSDYNVAGENTFLSTNQLDCLGFANLQSGNPDAIGNWAEVCVFEGAVLFGCFVVLLCVDLS
jgi:hypothetical protein